MTAWNPYPAIIDPRLWVDDYGTIHMATDRHWVDDFARLFFGLLAFGVCGPVLVIALANYVPTFGDLDAAIFFSEWFVVVSLCFGLGLLPLAIALSKLLLQHRVTLWPHRLQVEFATDFCGRTVGRRFASLEGLTLLTVKGHRENFFSDYLVAAHAQQGRLVLASFRAAPEAFRFATKLAKQLGLPPP